MEEDFIIFLLKQRHAFHHSHCLFTVFRLHSRRGLGCLCEFHQASRAVTSFLRSFLLSLKTNLLRTAGSQWLLLSPTFAPFAHPSPTSAGNLLPSLDPIHPTPAVLSAFLHPHVSPQRNLHSRLSSQSVDSHHSLAQCEMTSALITAPHTTYLQRGRPYRPPGLQRQSLPFHSCGTRELTIGFLTGI